MALTELTSKDLLKTWRERINEILLELKKFAVKNHASTDTTYGMGDENNYGHLRLSDSLNSPHDKTTGIAATPYAVSEVYKLANSALHLGNKIAGTLEITSVKGNLIGTANNAISDEEGNNIVQTYATKSELSQIVTNNYSLTRTSLSENYSLTKIPMIEGAEIGNFVSLDLNSDEENYVLADVNNICVIGVVTSIDTINKCDNVQSYGICSAKIHGKINKGDKITLSEISGCGKKYEENDVNSNVIGTSLETSTNENEISLLKIKLI